MIGLLLLETMCKSHHQVLKQAQGPRGLPPWLENVMNDTRRTAGVVLALPGGMPWWYIMLSSRAGHAVPRMLTPSKWMSSIAAPRPRSRSSEERSQRTAAQRPRPIF